MVIQFKAILLFQFIHLFLLKLYDIILVSYLCWPILSDRQEKKKMWETEAGERLWTYWRD